MTCVRCVKLSGAKRWVPYGIQCRTGGETQQGSVPNTFCGPLGQIYVFPRPGTLFFFSHICTDKPKNAAATATLWQDLPGATIRLMPYLPGRLPGGPLYSCPVKPRVTQNSNHCDRHIGLPQEPCWLLNGCSGEVLNHVPATVTGSDTPQEPPSTNRRWRHCQNHNNRLCWPSRRGELHTLCDSIHSGARCNSNAG